MAHPIPRGSLYAAWGSEPCLFEFEKRNFDSLVVAVVVLPWSDVTGESNRGSEDSALRCRVRLHPPSRVFACRIMRASITVRAIVYLGPQSKSYY